MTDVTSTDADDIGDLVVSVCGICGEPIRSVDGFRWSHNHGDVYCFTGDGSTAFPRDLGETPS